MKSWIIFPETTWIRSGLGFAGIREIADDLRRKNVEFRVTREYSAVVFEIENLNDEVIGLVREKLPSNCEIPCMLEGNCAIISNNEVAACTIVDEKFKKLMREAFLEVTVERRIEEVPEMSLVEINRLCNDFADSEHLPMLLKELDLERLHKSIHVKEEFEHKLVGILVDVKGIWFALEYDLSQLARNTGSNVNARFKRYVYINNAIVRIRALWEKLIGLAVLLEKPSDFDKILSNRRIRRAFIKQFKDSQHPVVRAIWDYVHSLDTFELRFRTPELHKIGRTIWWAAREKLGDEANRFIAYRNDLNRVLRIIVQEFEDVQR